jgi:hypothetical protein
MVIVKILDPWTLKSIVFGSKIHLTEDEAAYSSEAHSA